VSETQQKIAFVGHHALQKVPDKGRYFFLYGRNLQEKENLMREGKLNADKRSL